jgi:hypothetical protein
MEKESGIPKPGDLFIGVIDLFAVLVPGIIAAALIVNAVGARPQADVLFLSGLLISGWVLGHVLHGIGSWLDPLLYDRLFKPRDAVGQGAGNSRKGLRSAIQRYLHKNDYLFLLALQLTDLPIRQNTGVAATGVPGGMYQWARTWLDSRNPEATANLDRLEADSKLFRSLAVLLLIVLPVLIAVPDLVAIPAQWRVPAHPRGVLITLTLGTLLFSLWRYCDLRNKMIRRCYLRYVQLRFAAGYEDDHRQTGIKKAGAG